MRCFACVRVCPTDALKIDEDPFCTRLAGHSHLKFEEDKCNKCGKCSKVCPLGSIFLSAEGCSFCIICNGRPYCILTDTSRNSFLNFIGSIFRIVILMRRLIF